MEDQKRRSLMKGVTWRCIASIDTLLLSWIFTGSLTAALTIASLELLTKSVLYYVHERAWVRIPRLWQKKAPNTPVWSTSVFKAVTWRLLGALDTMTLAIIVTGDVGIAASIGSVEVVTKLCLYYVHERIWSTIRWGREVVTSK
ncbi:MAG: putative membrane protein [Patiriisocius sp.]|jgi:uncharacterized membrane protein